MARGLLSISFGCFLLLAISIPAQAAVDIDPPTGKSGISLCTGMDMVDNTTYIDANKILMFVTNHGNFGRDLDGVFGRDYGTYYPYMSVADIVSGYLTSSPLYGAGLWLGARDSATGQIHIALSEYSGEFVPGPMSSGSFMPDNPAFKVYKLYKDSLESNPNDDYINWPIDQGALVDGTDFPIMFGDQMLWTVFNDADPDAHDNNSGNTEPLGVEIHQTVWAFDEGGDDTIPLPQYLEVVQYGSQRVVVSVEVVEPGLLPGHDFKVITERHAVPDPVWHLYDVTAGSLVLTDRTDFTGSGIDTVSGMVIRVTKQPLIGGSWQYESADPANLSPVALTDYPEYTGGRWFTGAGDGELLEGGAYLGSGFTGSSLTDDQLIPIRIDFRPMDNYTDLNGNGRYTSGEPYVIGSGPDTSSAFMYSSWSGTSFEGFYEVPFTAWDISDPGDPRQLVTIVRDREENLQWNIEYIADPPDPYLPNDGYIRYNYIFIMDDAYDPSGTLYDDGSSGINFMENYGEDMPIQWTLWLDDRGIGGMMAEEGSLSLYPIVDTIMSDTFAFTANPLPALTTGPEGVSIYIEYKLFNEGGRTLKDFYISFWSDVDLGNAGNDFVGCDTLNDIFFSYNDGYMDSEYDAVPAIGFKILYGPTVPGAPADSALYFGQWRNAYKNLGLTAFDKFINGTDPDNAVETHNYMRGLQRDGSPYVYNGDTLAFMHSGDPVTGTGDLDAYSSDRRMMASTGPFDLRPGDSQYVLIKMAVGQDRDQLNSLTKTKMILNLPFDFPTDAEDGRPGVIPGKYALAQNFPNPFNPSTVIAYSLEKRSEVNISVYNILGQRVSTLIDETKPAGQYKVIWDGTDDAGKNVATGIYFYRLTAGDFAESKKMLLLK